MAVKKATAKKSAAKKAVAKATKKSVPKKSTVKKVAKKATTRKAASKNPRSKATTAKKAVVKKSAVKKAASKTSRTSATKKAATKKSAVKKVAESIVIPEAPIPTSRGARVEIVSTPMAAAPAPILTPVVPTSAPTTQPQKPGASSRVIFAVVVGIILLGLIVWAKGHNSNSATTKPTTTPTATTTPSATPTPTPSDTAQTLTAHEPPQGVVAHYTTTGATIFWKAPTALTGLSGYNVEISVSNGPWKLISTVPATQLSLDVTKENGNGWTSFKVSSVYTDSETVAAKAFGLPGTYS